MSETANNYKSAVVKARHLALTTGRAHYIRISKDVCWTIELRRHPSSMLRLDPDGTQWGWSGALERWDKQSNPYIEALAKIGYGLVDKGDEGTHGIAFGAAIQIARDALKSEV